MTSNLIRVFKRKRVLLLIFTVILVNFLNFYKRDFSITPSQSVVISSAWNENILVNKGSGLGINLYLILGFLLAGLAMADVFVEDEKTGYTNIALMKHRSVKRYIWTNYWSNFLYGGIFLLLPVLVNICLWLMVRPAWPMNYINSNLYDHILFPNLFVENTGLFFVIHFIKLFIAGGILASFMLYINTFSKSRYFGILATLVLDFIVSIVFELASYRNRAFTLTAFSDLINGLSFKGYLLSFIYYLIVLIIPLIFFKNYNKKIIL